MNKKLKLVLGLVIIIPIAGIIALIILLNINNTKTTKRDMDVINTNYNQLIDNVTAYNEVREKYAKEMEDFYLDNFLKKKEEYEELLNQYNVLINKIDKNAKEISSKCNHLYKDGSINKICNTYGKSYEKLVNLYVGDINGYNTRISEFNSYKSQNIPQFNMVHLEYIDYDNDGIYEGAIDNEGK